MVVVSRDASSHRRRRRPPKPPAQSRRQSPRIESFWGRKKGRTHCVVGELIEKKYLHKNTQKKEPEFCLTFFSLITLSLSLFCPNATTGPTPLGRGFNGASPSSRRRMQRWSWWWCRENDSFNGKRCVCSTTQIVIVFYDKIEHIESKSKGGERI